MSNFVEAKDTIINLDMIVEFALSCCDILIVFEHGKEGKIRFNGANEAQECYDKMKAKALNPLCLVSDRSYNGGILPL